MFDSCKYAFKYDTIYKYCYYKVKTKNNHFLISKLKKYFINAILIKYLVSVCSCFYYSISVL